MAVRNNNIQFKNAQFTFEDDGTVLIHEVTRDGELTHNFTEWLEAFSGEERFVDVTIREKFDVEGSGE